MARKLSEGEALKLIKLYGENECLWDIKSQNYRNKEMRLTALQNITKKMQIEGLTPMEVKKKIKGLRATYYLEVDKIKKSSRAGASGNVYVPKVKWFQELDAFIKNVTVKRKSIDNSETSNDDSDFADAEAERAGNISRPTNDNDNSFNRLTPSAETPAPNLGTEAPTQSGAKSLPKRYKLSHMAATVQGLKGVSSDINHMLPAVEETEFDIFGKHVAAQLKKLSEQQSVIAQEEIQKILSKCRLNDIQKKTNIYIYPNVHYSPTHSSP